MTEPVLSRGAIVLLSKHVNRDHGAERIDAGFINLC